MNRYKTSSAWLSRSWLSLNKSVVFVLLSSFSPALVQVPHPFDGNAAVLDMFDAWKDSLNIQLTTFCPSTKLLDIRLSNQAEGLSCFHWLLWVIATTAKRRGERVRGKCVREREVSELGCYTR